MADTELIDHTGRTVFRGTQKPPGGGSQPSLQEADFLFTEQPTPGTYAAALPILARTLVLDVLVYNLAGWDSADPLLTIGDTANGSVAYYNALNLATLGGPYDPTTPPNPSGGGAASLGNGGAALEPAAYAQLSQIAASTSPGAGVFYPADDTLTLAVVSTSPVLGADGITLVRVLYFPPVTPTVPTFTP